MLKMKMRMFGAANNRKSTSKWYKQFGNLLSYLFYIRRIPEAERIHALYDQDASSISLFLLALLSVCQLCPHACLLRGGKMAASSSWNSNFPCLCPVGDKNFSLNHGIKVFPYAIIGINTQLLGKCHAWQQDGSSFPELVRYMGEWSE